MTTAATETIRGKEGHSLLVSRAMNGRGERLPVLFIASVAADHTMWDAVRSRIDRRSVAYDTRGHGGSDVAERPLTVSDLAQDALAVLDAAGIERAVVCGLSLGGLTAMQLAADAPERVAGLVLANTATSFPPPNLWQDRAAKAAEGGWADLVQPTLERWLGADWRIANPHETARVRSMLDAMPPQGYADACAALETGDTTAALRGWDGPVQIIAGRNDMSVPLDRANEMKALAPQADLVVLDTAHVAAIEDADGFAAALQAFVDRVERADG